MNIEFFKGNEADIESAAGKEAKAIAYCNGMAHEAKGNDADLWEVIAYQLIPFRSRAFYKMDAKRAIEDKDRIYEPEELDKAFASYQRFCKKYNRTAKDIEADFTSPMARDLEAYIAANYIPA